MSRRYFAACTLGLETVLERELRALGAEDVASRPGGVECQGDRRLGYAACLWLRSASRLQELLLEGEAHSGDALRARVEEFPWEEVLGSDHTLAVEASLRDAPLTHSGYAALLVKDGIVDRFRRRSGRRPSVERVTPDVPLKLVWRGGAFRLGRELSGESLHKRGWRPVQVKSPLNEALAAGLLLLAEWDRKGCLVDPLCGSGTFLIEAAHLASDRAPGLQRAFAFQRWPDFDRALWDGLLREARARIRPAPPVVLLGVDHHEGALAIARRSLRAAGVEALVRLEQAEVADWQPRARPDVVVTNPPYGERLGEGEDLVGTWRGLGSFLHERCAGATGYVLSGNPELTRHLGLSASRRWPVHNGPLDCRWLRYEIRAKE